MTKITFVQADGERIETEGENGATVMETAIMNGVPGIVAECGGACTCATCHGYVDEAWVDRVPPATPDELDMIDAGCLDALPNSRLTCQIRLTDALDGLVIRLPPSQG